ncbi:hypothetical protein DFJ74DRAFT_695669 [Hyaloraphidium curvatum]|nr:hypothetical protein DFJ74DRAFT_695669 [Hyaloraphidium curvatum]
MNTLPCWLWLRGGEGAVPDAAFFASDPLGTVLECSVLAGKLMEAQMVAGGVPSVHTFAFTAAIKLCALYLAVAGTVASGGDAAARDAAVREAMVSFRYAEEVMATYPIAWRALAPRMHAMLAESGLFLLDRPGVGGTPGVRGQSPPAPVVVGTVKGMLPFASGALTPDPLISMLHSDGEAQEGDMAAGEE